MRHLTKLKIIYIAIFVLCLGFTLIYFSTRPQTTVYSSSDVDPLTACYNYFLNFNPADQRVDAFCTCMIDKVSKIEDLDERKIFQDFLVNYWSELSRTDGSKNQNSQRDQIVEKYNKSDAVSINEEARMASECLKTN